MANRRRKMIYKVYDEQCEFFWSWQLKKWIRSEIKTMVMARARSKRDAVRLAVELYDAGGFPILRQMNDVGDGQHHFHKERKRWIVDPSANPVYLQRLDRFGGHGQRRATQDK